MACNPTPSKTRALSFFSEAYIAYSCMAATRGGGRQSGQWLFSWILERFAFSIQPEVFFFQPTTESKYHKKKTDAIVDSLFDLYLVTCRLKWFSEFKLVQPTTCVPIWNMAWPWIILLSNRLVLGSLCVCSTFIRLASKHKSGPQQSSSRLSEEEETRKEIKSLRAFRKRAMFCFFAAEFLDCVMNFFSCNAIIVWVCRRHGHNTAFSWKKKTDDEFPTDFYYQTVVSIVVKILDMEFWKRFRDGNNQADRLLLQISCFLLLFLHKTSKRREFSLRLESR